MNINKAFQLIDQYYKSGNFKQAKNLCKQMLKQQPDNTRLLYMIELICCQLGEFDDAIKYLQKEIELTPANADVYYRLRTVLQSKGMYSEAIEYHTKAISINPALPAACYNLGLCFQNIGKIDEAIVCYKRAIQFEPKLMDAYNNVGILLSKKGCFAEAMTNFHKALEIDTNNFNVYNNIGLCLKSMDKVEDAIENFKKAISLNPLKIEVYLNICSCFRSKKKFDEAISYYKKALEISPENIEILFNLGLTYSDKEMFKEAIKFFKKVVEIEPKHMDAYFNIGINLFNMGDYENSIKYLKKTIEIRPNYAEAHYFLAQVFQHECLFEEAIVYYQKATEFSRKFSYMSYNNLGVVYGLKGQLDESEFYLKRSLAINFRYVTYSNLLFAMNYNPRYTAEDIFYEHLLFAKKFAEPLYSKVLPHENTREPERRIRVGYCSPDFRRHAVAYFIEPVLAEHNKEEFEVYCYSIPPKHVEDEVTRRIKGYSDVWRNIAGMSDEKVINLVREDRIDIFVDLAGHTGNNRILLFAYKPAPIQVSWIGYFTTTGLRTMDYKVVDSYTDPPGETERYFVEELLMMSETFLCYLPDRDAPDVEGLPVLRNGYITFGSFNTFAKVTAEVFDVWAEIMKGVPESRIFLKTKSFSDRATCEYVLKMFKERG